MSVPQRCHWRSGSGCGSSAVQSALDSAAGSAEQTVVPCQNRWGRCFTTYISIVYFKVFLFVFYVALYFWCDCRTIPCWRWVDLRFNQTGNVRESSHSSCRPPHCVGHHSRHADHTGRQRQWVSDTVSVHEKTLGFKVTVISSLTAVVLVGFASHWQPVTRETTLKSSDVIRWFMRIFMTVIFVYNVDFRILKINESSLYQPSSGSLFQGSARLIFTAKIIPATRVSYVSSELWWLPPTGLSSNRTYFHLQTS